MLMSVSRTVGLFIQKCRLNKCFVNYYRTYWYQLVMALKAHKELEIKVHEHLYNNISLLTFLYPPTEEFQNVFKKDMFFKNNKVAFHHVVHYLLNVLDPEKFKQKVSSWPIYEIRLESQFRSEVMKYINELNTIYEDANIPTILTSHLISPGGFKFMKFMLKLSELVLYEHLQKDPKFEGAMVMRIKPNKVSTVTEGNIKRLNILTQKNSKHVTDLKVNFEKKLADYVSEAESILKKKQEINVELPLLKEECRKLQSKFSAESDINTSIMIDQKKEIVQEKINVISRFSEKFVKVNCLVSDLCNRDLLLDFNDEVRDKISSIYQPLPTQELDLLSFLNTFNALADNRCLQMRSLTPNDLSFNIKKYSNINDQLRTVVKNFDEIRKQFYKLRAYVLQNEVKHNIKLRNPLIVLQDEFDTTINSNILAVPLDSSSENK